MSTKPRIAVIGLGIMGNGVADNFLKNDYEVVVWNRTPEKAEELVSNGAKIAATVQEAVQSADIVFEITANDESSQEIWLGDGGIIKNAKTNQYLITCATISTVWTDELAATCSDAGLTFFDMPMTGGRIGAESGQLTLLAGGSKEKLAEISEDLKAISKEVKLFGGAGSGMRYKLILNSLQAIHMAGLGEALKMAEVAGLDIHMVGNALVERPGGVVTNIGWQSYQQEPDPITFSVEWITKDLKYAAEMAKNMEHPLLDGVLRRYEKIVDAGFAQSDWSKIEKL